MSFQIPGILSGELFLETWERELKKTLGNLARLPRVPENDPKLAELLLALGHLRRSMPIAKIWQAAKAGDLERALSGCLLLTEPFRWTLLVAIAACFAERGDGPAFDRVWPLVVTHAGGGAPSGDLPNAALAQCAAFRPSTLADLWAAPPRNAGLAFKILARRAPVDQVAAAFAVLENLGSNAKVEELMNDAVRAAGRHELAAACLPLISHSTVELRDGGDSITHSPSQRRDRLRELAVMGLSHRRRFPEAMAYVSQLEDPRLAADEGTQLLVEMGEPLRAKDVFLKAAKKFGTDLAITSLHMVVESLGKFGHILEALEVAEEGKEYSRGYRDELILNACEAAIENGHGATVEAHLDRIPSKRIRKKLEEKIARDSQRPEPKSIRGRAAAWVERPVAEMPQAIAAIRSLLAEAKPADRPMILATLLRAQGKAGMTAELDQTARSAASETQAIARRSSRLEATMNVAAAMVSVGRREAAFDLLDTVGEFFEDEDEARQFLFGFVQACAALHLRQQLDHLPESDEDRWFFLSLEEVMVWSGVSDASVEQLVAKAKRSGNFGDVIDILRAERRFATGAAVLRQVPDLRAVDGRERSLLEQAAEFGQLAVAEEILATIRSPIPGEHPPEITAVELLNSYAFRSAFGLSGGTLEHLIAALSEPLDSSNHDFAIAIKTLVREGDFLSQDSLLGRSDARSLCRQRGSREAALQDLRSRERNIHLDARNAKLFLAFASLAIDAGEPAATVESLLAEACDRLTMVGQSAFEHREVMVLAAQFQTGGFEIQGFVEKARELIALPANAYVATFHLIHLHAALGDWVTALSLLPDPCSRIRDSVCSYDSGSYPWRVLLQVPLDVLRDQAASICRSLPGCWMVVAVLFARHEGGAPKAELLRSLATSMQALGKNV